MPLVSLVSFGSYVRYFGDCSVCSASDVLGVCWCFCVVATLVIVVSAVPLALVFLVYVGVSVSYFCDCSTCSAAGVLGVCMVL